MIKRALITMVLALCAGAALAQQVERSPVPTSAPRAERAPAADPAGDDARRAAAGRLLAASRFRERQAVLLGDAIRAAQAELTADCVDRAAAGRSLGDCRATASGSPVLKARLDARRSDMLDEILTASQTIYARRFTAAEMDEIKRFFRTPVGRKYGELYPQVIGEVQARRGAIIRRYLADTARPR